LVGLPNGGDDEIADRLLGHLKGLRTIFERPVPGGDLVEERLGGLHVDGLDDPNTPRVDADGGLERGLADGREVGQHLSVDEPHVLIEDDPALVLEDGAEVAPGDCADDLPLA
jgi:hypothetical protein